MVRKVPQIYYNHFHIWTPQFNNEELMGWKRIPGKVWKKGYLNSERKEINGWKEKLRGCNDVNCEDWKEKRSGKA